MIGRGLQFEEGIFLPGKEGNQVPGKLGHRIKGETVRQFPRADPEVPSRIAAKEALQTGEDLFGVHKDPEHGIVLQVKLQDAVSTVEGTAGSRIEDGIVTADEPLRSGTLLDELAGKGGKKEPFLSFRDRIGTLLQRLNQGIDLGRLFHGDSWKTIKKIPGKGGIPRTDFENNPFDRLDHYLFPSSG